MQQCFHLHSLSLCSDWRFRFLFEMGKSKFGCELSSYHVLNAVKPGKNGKHNSGRRLKWRHNEFWMHRIISRSLLAKRKIIIIRNSISRRRTTNSHDPRVPNSRAIVRMQRKRWKIMKISVVAFNLLLLCWHFYVGNV